MKLQNKPWWAQIMKITWTTLMGPPSQVEPRPAEERPRDSHVVIQRNPYGVRVLGRGARSKNKRQSPPAGPSGSSTNVPATRLERRMEAAQSIRTRDNVAHSRVNHHQLLLGNWNILTLTGKELELVEEAKRYHLDIIGVSSTKRRGSGTVDLDGGWKLFYSGADPSMSAQAGVGILTSPVCQTVSQIGLLWDHGSVCWSSWYWIGHCAYCRYMPPMPQMNVRLLWMK